MGDSGLVWRLHYMEQGSFARQGVQTALWCRVVCVNIGGLVV